MTEPSERVRLPRYVTAPVGTHPPMNFAGYASTALRYPLRTPIDLPQRLTEVTGPVLGDRKPGDLDADLTRQHGGEPHGQRIIVQGQVVDSSGLPVPHSLVEIWQANAGGRYRHVRDRWDSPLDPNFSGLGRTMTDVSGRYKFITIKPGAYPWKNHLNAWRPAHIHFSLFGRAFTQRLVTQMYFPDDQLFAQDPIFNSIPDPLARQRLVSRFNLDETVPAWALAFDFDIVLRGQQGTPFETDDYPEDEE